MEYWIVYDTASGLELYRGSGSSGSAAYQSLPPGAGLVVVPQAVVASPTLNLAALRVALSARIDAAAEKVRNLFLTPGSGQAMTYSRKEAEARAWIANNSAPAPFLAAEAAARGLSVAAVANEVIALADMWTQVGSQIEAIRLGGKKAVQEADTLGEIVTAAAVDWQPLQALSGA